MPLLILAAGSLRPALTALAETMPDDRPSLAFGPAGLLRQAIEQGRACDVFLSANLAHPVAIARGTDATCRVFARNPLRVVARADIGLQANTLLDQLLDPALRLGTSTPGADPSGDYAVELFERADRLRPGAGARLAAKARHVVGGTVPTAAAPRKDGEVAQLLAGGTIDAFVCYRSSALAMPPDLHVVTPPPELAVTAAYAFVVLRPGDAAERFVGALTGDHGQSILAQHGFDPP